jgi:hypothetical protein
VKSVIKQLVVGPLRYAIRQVLQRPWLKKRVREMLTRMPGLHAILLRVMFQTPAAAQPRRSAGREDLSPNAQRAHRALKQAIRTRKQ